MNQFADLTVEEFRSRALGYDAQLRPRRPLRAGERFIYEDTKPPAGGVDWRAKGAVAEVKNQLLVRTAASCCCSFVLLLGGWPVPGRSWPRRCSATASPLMPAPPTRH